MFPPRTRRAPAVLSSLGALAAVALVAGAAVAQPADGAAEAEAEVAADAEPAGPPTFDPDVIYDVPLAGSPRRGPADALLTVVEFSDYACPYCTRAQATLEQLDTLYPGQVRYVFRHRPLDAELTLAAEASAAAALQGRFWPMHDRLFAVQGQVDRGAVELHAAQLGLDLARFRADLDSGRARALVDADVADGNRLGMTGTPTFFVNGRPVVGARRLGAFALVFAEELARARRAAADQPPDLYAALIAGGRARADVVAPPRRQPTLDPQQVVRVGLGLPGHTDGPDDALVTIVYWSDYECPYCVRLAPVLARLRAERPAEVRVVLRHLPLGNHAGADLAAEAAVEAARAGKLPAFHRAINEAAAPLTREVVLAAADEAGVRAAVAAALDDHRHRDAVMADAAAGFALGITGTPTMFVNGQPLVGSPRYEALLALVDEKAAGARQLVAEGIAASDVYDFVTRNAAAGEVGDPRRRPRSTSIAAFELGGADREAAVLAACVTGDAAGARAVAGGLRGPRLDRLRALCRDRGVDLP